MPGMNERFVSNGLSLACHIARPSGDVDPGPAVILCHGFPIASLDAQRSAGTFPELIDRICREIGCVAMTFNFRGCGESEGDFSLQGWVDDLRNAISHVLAETTPTGVILLGTNTGGSIAICVAADDPRVSAAGLLSPRADFDDWAEHPRRFLDHAREIGAIHNRQFPPSVEEWTARVPSVPAGRICEAIRTPAAVGDARRGGRQRAGVRCPPAGQRPRQCRTQPVRRCRPPPASRPTRCGGAVGLVGSDPVGARASEFRTGLTSPFSVASERVRMNELGRAWLRSAP